MQAMAEVEELVGLDQAAVLDVGSGPTCIARFFKYENCTYIDPLMGFFKEHYSDRLPMDEHSAFVNAMAEDMPFDDESFDIAFCYNMLDHGREPARILSEIRRVLKPDGYLLLGVSSHNRFMQLLRGLGEISWLFKENPHPHSFTLGDMKSMLAEGFDIRRDLLWGKEKPYNFRRRFHLFTLQKNRRVKVRTRFRSGISPDPKAKSRFYR